VQKSIMSLFFWISWSRIAASDMPFCRNSFSVCCEAAAMSANMARNSHERSRKLAFSLATRFSVRQQTWIFCFYKNPKKGFC
jgi:hypothetical protein